MIDKECNIEVQNTIRPKLYYSRPIRLQILCKLEINFDTFKMKLYLIIILHSIITILYHITHNCSKVYIITFFNIMLMFHGMYYLYIAE